MFGSESSFLQNLSRRENRAKDVFALEQRKDKDGFLEALATSEQGGFCFL